MPAVVVSLNVSVFTCQPEGKDSLTDLPDFVLPFLVFMHKKSFLCSNAFSAIARSDCSRNFARILSNETNLRKEKLKFSIFCDLRSPKASGIFEFVSKDKKVNNFVSNYPFIVWASLSLTFRLLTPCPAKLIVGQLAMPSGGHCHIVKHTKQLVI